MSAPAAHPFLRFLAVIGSVVSAVLAGWLFLVAWAFQSGVYENTDPGSQSGGLVMAAMLGAFAGCCTAICGLLYRSTATTRVGGLLQLLGALSLIVLGAVREDEGVIELVLVVTPFVVYAGLVVAFAGGLTRSR